MKIKVICIGKTSDDYLKTGFDLYLKRLTHYVKLEWIELSTPKKWNKFSAEDLKREEGKWILSKYPSDSMYLLDENGKEHSSEQFAQFFSTHQNRGTSEMTLIIGGAFGFSDELKQKARGKISLSKMTFNHQMVRLFLIEQIYRAHTIIRNEKYHNA